MDIFLYPVNNDSNDIILSDPTSLRLVITTSVDASVAGGGGWSRYRSLGSYYESDTLPVNDDLEVLQIIKIFLSVR
jgi:hypothetical protein